MYKTPTARRPTHTHKHSGDTSAGSPGAEGCKALRVSLLKVKQIRSFFKIRTKDGTVHVERADVSWMKMERWSLTWGLDLTNEVGSTGSYHLSGSSHDWRERVQKVSTDRNNALNTPEVPSGRRGDDCLCAVKCYSSSTGFYWSLCWAEDVFTFVQIYWV